MEISEVRHSDQWQDIKDATMRTIGKDTGKYPDHEWKQKLIFSEHSPIRIMKFFISFKKIKYWVVMHLVRHKFGIEHFVSTQRTDRTGIDRDSLPQDNEISYSFDADAQALINISRKRLCSCAADKTRKAWQMVKDEVAKTEPELAHCMVRECVYRGGICPEMFSCGYNKTEAFKEEYEEYIAPIKDQVV